MVKKRQKFNSARRNMRKKKLSFWQCMWRGLCSIFSWIWAQLKAFWKWLGKINLVALLNLVLLITIIVLFSMLIMDITCCKKNRSVTVKNPEPQLVVAEKKHYEFPTLPIKKNRGRSVINRPIDVVPVKPDPVAVRQTPVSNEKSLMGDIIIDSRGVASVIKNNTKIYGNLYLQNMRKYVLPCNVTVNGNIFLRDLNMLQFCGKFSVTGNIYVSPRSSFGPLPCDAHIGGQIIL